MTLVKNYATCHPKSRARSPFAWNRFWNEVGTADSRWTGTTQPGVNISENEDGFRIEVAAPGFSREDFKVSIEHKVLSISGSKAEKDQTDNFKYRRKEFAYGEFERKFKLGEGIDQESVSATYFDGILLVTLAKREEAKDKPARTIDIS